MVRVKDALRGRFTVHLDNRGANHPRRVTFSGSDDEGVVRFEFDPAVVEVPPDGGAAVQVRVMAQSSGTSESRVGSNAGSSRVAAVHTMSRSMSK